MVPHIVAHKAHQRLQELSISPEKSFATLSEVKRTCRLFPFGQASELSIPLDWELLEEIVEREGGRLSAFEDSFDKAR